MPIPGGDITTTEIWVPEKDTPKPEPEKKEEEKK